MTQLLGIHWIATTYGTWLHGDLRGSWYQGNLIDPDPFLESAIRLRMTHHAVVLSAEECDLVADTIRKICEEQNHSVLTMAIEPTHVHVLFAPMDEPIKVVVARLKRRSATAVLHRRRLGSGQDGRAIAKSLWSAGRFIVYIDDDVRLQNAMEYVERHAHGVVVNID